MEAIKKLKGNWEYAWNNSITFPLRDLREAKDRLSSPILIYVKNGPIRISYVGMKSGLNHGFAFLLDQVQSHLGQELEIDKDEITWKEASELTTESGSQGISVIGATESWLQNIQVHTDYVLPMRIHYLVELNIPNAKIENRLSPNIQRRFRKTETIHNWRFVITNKREDFTDFFRNIHLPTMNIRHGNRTRSESEDAAYHGIFKNGFLFSVIDQHNVPVAGALCKFANNRSIHMRSLGVRYGDSKFYSNDLNLYLYISLLLWSEKEGYLSVEMSGSEPFISKGLFQFKRKFDPTIVIPRTHYRKKRLLLRLNKLNRHEKDFLTLFPILAFEGGPTLKAFFFKSENLELPNLGWSTRNIIEKQVVEI